MANACVVNERRSSSHVVARRNPHADHFGRRHSPPLARSSPFNLAGIVSRAALRVLSLTYALQTLAPPTSTRLTSVHPGSPQRSVSARNARALARLHARWPRSTRHRVPGDSHSVLFVRTHRPTPQEAPARKHASSTKHTPRHFASLQAANPLLFSLLPVSSYVRLGGPGMADTARTGSEDPAGGPGTATPGGRTARGDIPITIIGPFGPMTIVPVGIGPIIIGPAGPMTM